MTLVVIAKDAIPRLGDYVQRQGWYEPLAVMDANTREAVGDAVLAEIGGREYVFPERHGLLAGPEQVKLVREQLIGQARAIAVGSGVITDIVRYASHLAERDFISVPTAASMDGYASSVAALQINGVKVTYPAQAPAAIFADPRVCAAAPAELTRAGLCDLLAKATARVDWLAAHLLYGESFDAAAAQDVLEPLEFAASRPREVLGGGRAPVQQLLAGLVQSGIAMSAVGNSRPASGCEHHASHFWDLLAAKGRRAHASHGLQVGYGTRFAMRLQRYAFGGRVASLRTPVPVDDPLDESAREWLGEPSPEVRAAVAEKRVFTSQPMSRDWDAVRARLASSLELFPAVDSALDIAEIPSQPGYLEIDEATLRAAFLYANRLRARYTTIDFLEGQQLLDDALEAMLS